ncbi:MAG: DNA-binding protein [Phycisphaerae bacterium]|nr:DNA-binding protein [Phycisphaerae bacterium]
MTWTALACLLAVQCTAFAAGEAGIPLERMQAVYDEVKTPYKVGIVIPAPEGKRVDCPTVFRHGDRWYMVYVQLENDPQGYTTQLAASNDLLHWEPLGTILARGQGDAWDRANAAGGIALANTRWGGDGTLEQHEGRYWMSYLGGEKPGYETPPLSIGVASTLDPASPTGWDRPVEPVLRPNDPDARPFETGTLFKSFIFRDPGAGLGAPFVMYYNARPDRGDETIGMAVSGDMRTWRRYGDGPVIVNARPPDLKHGVISGDPQIVRMDVGGGDLWVMFYFGAFWRPKAFDTFAASTDLVHWTQWEGPALIEPSEPWDNEFAHKPWIIKHNGVVYHFYCAAGNQGRAIALATSKPIQEIKPVGSTVPADSLEARFKDPPPCASPWVFWYWMRGAVSKQGITADLEAMKAAGIGGAYLFSIQEATDPALWVPSVRQLTPEWWALARHAMAEADRLGLHMGMHACDGFSVAGGPWITPELSMQRLVWTQTQVQGGRRIEAVLPQPQAQEGFYRDIAVLAFPSVEGAGISTRTVVPKVTTSVPGVDPQFLVAPDARQRLRSDSPCWIQYAFERPFTCRSITVRPEGTSFQPLRLRIEASDDGQALRPITQLEPPRHGWQNGDADVTYSLTPVTARTFRFVYDPAGTEPGSEDLDSAKWRPSLRVRGIELSSEPRIHQFEGKTGQVWRVAGRTTARQVPDGLCVPQDRIVDITEHLDGRGRLQWAVPEGTWTILRMGHTSTGHRNTTGGGGVGLECDKFNPEAVRLQYDRWFAEAVRQIGPDLAGRVLKVLHVDSWEAGSQNWSPVFREEFRRRRGYDLLPCLPAMAGIPIGSAEGSERFLQDVRETIGELVTDRFFGTLADLAHRQGCTFSAENVAPTMTCDGMRHFGVVDVPMGEFWLRSPTHDKPNDMLDAISGGHVYGRPIVQAEAFTELQFPWDEHPALIKALGDRQLALGINRFVMHVFVHNPWLDRRPGMTLGPTGLFFQRDQTWWRPGRAWVDYLRRCQVLLQTGRPVADVAVFTGEGMPRRAVLPDQLVSTLPGVIGPEALQREAGRMANEGQPLRALPKAVTASAHIRDLADWVDPLRGYAYDSINRDALLRLARVRNRRIELPGGAGYALLVLPGPHPMSPDTGPLSSEMAARLSEWMAAGVPIVDCRSQLPSQIQNPGSGIKNVVRGPFSEDSFDSLGIARDFTAAEDGRRAEGVAWTHRSSPEAEIYFCSNQQGRTRTLEVSVRVTGRVPELWDPRTAEVRPAVQWQGANGRTTLPLRLDPNGSIFVVLREPTQAAQGPGGLNWIEPRMLQEIQGPWQVAFDPCLAGPPSPVGFAQLEDWSRQDDLGIRHYSGTAVYTKTFAWNPEAEGSESETVNGQCRAWLDLGEVADIAEVAVNGRDCGVAWTPPYRVEITGAVRSGSNDLEVRVTNTWANRLIGDQALPESQRVTWTSAPDRLGRGPLLRAGLLGPVRIMTSHERGPADVLEEGALHR